MLAHCRTLTLAAAIGASSLASAADLNVMSSGGFTAALQQLAPVYERKSGDRIHIVLGPSMGTAPEAIPNRLARGEKADLLIMVGYALDALATQGAVDAASKIDLADSRIGLAVKAGAPRPDISDVAHLKDALRAARSIAYSDSASGVYIEKEMYGKLGMESELKPKSRMIVAERVGDVVARGDAEIGFQQISELKPSKGADIVGPIPEAVQKVTVFSAGVPTAAAAPEAARSFLKFLSSAEARPVVAATGLDPRF